MIQSAFPLLEWGERDVSTMFKKKGDDLCLGEPAANVVLPGNQAFLPTSMVVFKNANGHQVPSTLDSKVAMKSAIPNANFLNINAQDVCTLVTNGMMFDNEIDDDTDARKLFCCYHTEEVGSKGSSDVDQMDRIMGQKCLQHGR